MSKRSNSCSPTDPKRPRASASHDQQDEQHPPYPFPRLEAARFPPEVAAIPHILTQIDLYLMTEDEALIEAAKTGDAEWLEELLDDVDDNSVIDAILEASGCGHADCVEVLLEEYAFRNVTAYVCWEKLLKAFEAAATNNQLEVLKVLLSKVTADSNGKGELCGAAHGALLIAAERGFLDMLKYVVQYLKEQDDPLYRSLFCSSCALSRAISGGQKVMIEYLLGLDEFSWDLRGAFVAAVDAGDNSLADTMYELYMKKPRREEFFVTLVCCGHLDAAKYLYEAGHNDPELIGEAFVKAARRLGKSTLEFLLSTRRVLSEAFDKGFEAAALSWDRVKLVPFFLDKKRVSAKSINQAFVAARSSDVMEILLEREHVLDESICAVFEKATGSLGEYSDGHYSRGEKEFIGVIKLLYTKDCIPAETIGKALVIAAWKGESELVTLLRSDGRISARTVGEAFAAAALREENGLMMTLYDTTISPDAILVAFSKAASRERTCNVKELVELLSDNDRVPQEFKHKAFVIAAQLRHDAVLELLCESVDGNWPLAILQEALAVAEHDEVKNLIRKVICGQLFDPNFDGLVGMVSKFMEARISDPFSSAE